MTTVPLAFLSGVAATLVVQMLGVAAFIALVVHRLTRMDDWKD